MYFMQISLKFDPRGPIEYQSALVQVMAWYHKAAKWLPKPIITITLANVNLKH